MLEIGLNSESLKGGNACCFSASPVKICAK